MRKSVAVIGASNDRRKFGNRAVRAFAAEGYAVFPINPRESHVEGLPAFPSVLAVPEPIGMATVYLPPDAALAILPDLARKGIAEIWFNPGSESEAVERACRELGLHAIFACSIVGVGRLPSEFPETETPA